MKTTGVSQERHSEHPQEGHQTGRANPQPAPHGGVPVGHRDHPVLEQQRGLSFSIAMPTLQVPCCLMESAALSQVPGFLVQDMERNRCLRLGLSEGSTLSQP
ncbi:hypothetical protein KIL84_023514 [Mauremys mutica]|uniref:Uncharacterized protein n=1 Tax=Mauremys mutica TaxID=74926 RepID=A0A9D3WSK7_9SAUR|nr:hypothetical protein KIL84_023514 [Mauremys mutica]